MDNLDTYMKQDNVVQRLVNEYNLHGDLVVAYDFDNTVYDYHNMGDEYHRVIELIKKLGQIKGIELIVWTGSRKEKYGWIKEWLNENDIPFNKINENPYFFKSDSPKIFYSILLDDRAGLESSYNALLKFLNKINQS